MQNRDGGWGAFDKDNDLELLCYVPFADHNAMIDPSTPDITGRVLEMLGQYGYDQRHRAVERAITYLRRTQEADGAWVGRWGVNYVYGTWSALCAYNAAGVDPQSPVVRKAAPSVVNVYASRVEQAARNPFCDDPLFGQFFCGGRIL